MGPEETVRGMLTGAADKSGRRRRVKAALVADAVDSSPSGGKRRPKDAAARQQDAQYTVVKR